MHFSSGVSVLLLALISAVSAHPGEIEEFGTPARRQFLREAKRSIAACEDHIYTRGIEAAAVERRAARARELRERLGLDQREYINKRDFDTVLATDHKSNKTNLHPWSSPRDIFTGKLQCVLQSETTEGPYYVKGEHLRYNVVERQRGIPLFTDYQIVDVNTCKPVPGVFLDQWHANSTGVYGGVVARGNGNIDDASNLNATFLRGVTLTDINGVAYFETIFPGHYTGRTSHIHILATVGPTIQKNLTITGGHVAHVGQVFFDQSLINTVESKKPYTTNTQPLMLNANDFIFREEAASMDPVMNYVWLGKKPEDGILSWITIGIDTTKSYNVTQAVDLTKNGGVVNPNAGMGGPPGGPGGPGGPPPSGFPSGAFPPPTGAPSSAVPTSSAV